MDLTKLKTVVEHAETHPDQFDMDEWVEVLDYAGDLAENPHCGTRACLAGLTVILFDGLATITTIDGKRSQQGDFAWCMPPGRKRAVSIDERAQELLGLTESQSFDLFYGDADSTNVREYVERSLKVTL
jgi:hypothetical protein